jgi:hypothetical protein
MRHILAVLLMVFVASQVQAKPRPGPRHFNERGGFFAQVDFDVGGDDVVYDSRYGISERSTGEGEQVLLGMFYQPWARQPIELYLGGGIKYAHIVPVRGGGLGGGDFSRKVVDFKAQYRFSPRLFAGAGLTHHASIDLTRADAVGADLRFKGATGLTVEAGWSFLGLHATYMKYKPEGGGPSIDASSVGARFLLRF